MRREAQPAIEALQEVRQGAGVKIQAAVLRRLNSPFSIETLDLAPPRAGEVLVRVLAAGVCHSDWHLATGDSKHPLPVVPGHEGSGVVQDVGEGVNAVQPGDHVVLNWSPACGGCFYCGGGQPYLCGTFVDRIWAGTMLDGTTRLSADGRPVYHFSALACFAEHAVVPQECCVPIDRAVPFPVAALIGCAVTTGVGAVLNTAAIPPGSRVAVFGAGGVGLSAVMGANLADAKQIIAVDPFLDRCEAATRLGATDVVAVNGADSVAAANTIARIRELTEGRGADYVIEAVGRSEVQEQCLEAARPGGMIVLAGLSPMGSRTNLPGALITRQEKTVKGSYYGSSLPARDFPKLAELFLRGQLLLDRLVSRTYRLDEINAAYADMLAGRIARGVIAFD